MGKEKTSFVYVTYIRSTPEKVFEAITKPEIARRWRLTLLLAARRRRPHPRRDRGHGSAAG